MQQYQPLHADRHRSSFNFSLILSVGVAFIGLVTGEPLVFVIGLAFAAFAWFTTPSQYMIFNDRLVIAYGKPRIRQILFQQVDLVEVLKLPIGHRLLVRLTNGRRMIIQPRDAEQFQTMFQGALETYQQDHVSERPQESQQPPDPADERPDSADERPDSADERPDSADERPDPDNWPSRDS